MHRNDSNYVALRRERVCRIYDTAPVSYPLACMSSRAVLTFDLTRARTPWIRLRCPTTILTSIYRPLNPPIGITCSQDVGVAINCVCIILEIFHLSFDVLFRDVII
jgi:hypothetical protein